MFTRVVRISAVLTFGAVGVLGPVSPADAGAAPATADDVIFYRAGPIPDGFLIANGDGTFEQRSLAVTGYYSPLVGNFDGDGDSDVLWNGGYDRTFLWTSSGDGGFVSTRVLLETDFQTFVGDFNDDGLDDLLDLDYLPEAPSSTHLSDGAGGFTEVDAGVNMGTEGVVLVGDHDGDGDDDVMVYGPGSQADGFFLSDGDGTFTAQPLNIGGFYEPQIGDYDDDGHADVFFYAAGGAADYLLLSDGDGTFTSIRFQVIGLYTPLPGDYDGDGDTDIMWYGYGTRPDYLWTSNGDGSFTSARRSVSGKYQPEVLRADTNGTDDILWYRPGPASDFVWLHDGTARPTSVQQFIDFGNPYGFGQGEEYFECCFFPPFASQLVGDFVTS